MIIIQYARMESILFDLGIDPNVCNLVMQDNSYALPTKTWLLNTFGPDLRKVFDSIGFPYRPESEDCDDFARFGASYAQLLHARNMDMPQDCALAVAEFVYKPAWNVQRHAILAALTASNDQFELVFVEPQTGREQMVIREERQLCTFMRF